MFRDIESVVRNDARSITLKRKKRSDETLERKFVQIVFEARALTVADGFHYESETRLASDQPPVQGFLEEHKAIEKGDGDPTFTVTKSAFNPSILAEITTKDALYWFKEGHFGGELENHRVSIAQGSKPDFHGAIAHVWDASPDRGDKAMFMLEIVLPPSEFERLHRVIWFAKAPCSLRIVVGVVCFQDPIEARANVAFPDNYVLEANSHTYAKLKSVAVNQDTIAMAEKTKVVEDEDTGEQIDPTLAAAKQLQSTMTGIYNLLWWVATCVIAVTLILLWHR